MSFLGIETWHNWEEYYKKILDVPEIQKMFLPKEVLIGFTDATGRISFSGKEPQVKTKLNKEFNQLDYLVPIIANRKYVEELPSIASIMPEAQDSYLIVHPYENEEDDIDNVDEIFESIENNNQPIYGICILDSESADMSHGIAYIAWKDTKDKRNLAFYDPLSYRRKKKKDSNEFYYTEYDYAKQVFQWINEESEISFQIHDLSKHCMFRNKEEFDCPQYQINAEYCYFYSLHFLYTWAYLGKPITRLGLKKAVEKSYIIPMEKISREYNLDTMKYRIIMFSFIITVFTKYFENLDDEEKMLIPNYNQNVEHLKIISIAWKELYDLPLIPN
jgi:hypothetical protein